MNTKYLILPILFVLDIITKVTLDKSNTFERIQYHHRQIPIWFVIPICAAFYLAYKHQSYRFPLLLLNTGAILNFIDGRDGVVTNPFVFLGIGNAIAFNIADLCIFIGSILCIVATFRTKRASLVTT